MKGSICTVVGAIGGGIAALFGGWDSALLTLIIFMGIDFATGMITGAMGKSKHSKTGKLNSKAGWYGLAKKGSILMLIIVAVRLDILLNTNYVRDAVCIAFCVNELLSIVENTSLIDVSVHNGKIDWQKVRAAGIDFAILRAGYGRLASQKDDRFEENYVGAKAAGIPVGAYWYSYAMSEDEARLEADVFLSVIKGKQFEFPVYFDLEEKKQFDLGKEKVSAIMRAFLERVEAAGYFVGLYGSASSLTTHTADDIKSRYTIWLAHWCNQTNYSDAYGIWQHSEKGNVDGINGNVDLDICYKDFPAIIKAKGLNGYGKEPNPPAPAAEDGITVEVTVDGKKYSGKLNKA